MERVALSDVNGDKQIHIHRATSPETAAFKESWYLKLGGPKYKSIDTIKFRRLDDYFAESNLVKLEFVENRHRGLRTACAPGKNLVQDGIHFSFN